MCVNRVRDVERRRRRHDDGDGARQAIYREARSSRRRHNPMRSKRGIDRRRGRRRRLEKAQSRPKIRKRSLRSHDQRERREPSASSSRSDGEGPAKKAVITVEKQRAPTRAATSSRVCSRPRLPLAVFVTTRAHGSVARGVYILNSEKKIANMKIFPRCSRRLHGSRSAAHHREASRVRRSRPSSSTSSAARSNAQASSRLPSQELELPELLRR